MIQLYICDLLSSAMVSFPGPRFSFFFVMSPFLHVTFSFLNVHHVSTLARTLHFHIVNCSSNFHYHYLKHLEIFLSETDSQFFIHDDPVWSDFECRWWKFLLWKLLLWNEWIPSNGQWSWIQQSNTLCNALKCKRSFRQIRSADWPSDSIKGWRDLCKHHIVMWDIPQ